MTVSWWTVYLLDQLSRRVSGNDKREGNQYYNVLPVSSENGLDDRESLSHPHMVWSSVRTPMCVLAYECASLQNKSATYLHPHDTTDSETTCNTYRAHTQHEQNTLSTALKKLMSQFWDHYLSFLARLNFPSFLIYHFSYCLLLPVYKHSSLTFMLPLFRL